MAYKLGEKVRLIRFLKAHNMGEGRATVGCERLAPKGKRKKERTPFVRSPSPEGGPKGRAEHKKRFSTNGVFLLVRLRGEDTNRNDRKDKNKGKKV